MKLYQHQNKALDQTTQFNKVAYYLDMGLGKTYVGAEKMKQLNSRVNLLICQKSKIADWKEHFEKHYTKEILVYDLTRKAELEAFLDVSEYVPFSAIGVINYELAWRRKDLLKLEGFTLMLDESSLIQHRTAKQSKFILKLQPENVILLSGTPSSGKYENLWTQAKLLGWDISEKLFNRHYINFELVLCGDGLKHKVINRQNPYKNFDRLKRKFAEHGAVFLKTEECFSLPEQNFIEVKILKSKEYIKFMKNSIITVEDRELVGDTNLTKRLYARMLCGQYSEDKLEAFKNLLESTNDRLIVFYNFTEELIKMRLICEMLNKPISIINGSEKNLKAYEEQDNSVTLIQYQAGAMGLNLQKANRAVYFTLPERSELFEQSKKRIHRIGQERPCFYYLLMCRDSLEERIYEALKIRKDYDDKLFLKEIKNA